MGKSKTGGAFGFIKKSIGSVTYSTLKDKNGRRVQILRSKPTDVANPNTVSQILQRMKVKPAARFFNKLSEILDNAFENVPYGSNSRREFMSLAMKLTGPYVPKTATRFIPANYPMSRGSLAEAGVLKYEEMDSINVPVYGTRGFFYDINSAGPDTSMSLADIFANAYGRDVQLTFVAVTQTPNGDFECGYNRVLSQDITFVQGSGYQLNLGNNACVRIENQDVLNYCLFYAAQDLSEMTSDEKKAAFAGVVAAAVIVSYKDGDAWLRSNSDMLVNDALQVNLYGTDAMNAAIESYQDTASVNELNSSWYLNLANGQQYPGRITLMEYTIETTVTVEGEPQLVTKEVTMPIGQRISESGTLQPYMFTNDGTKTGDAIFFSEGEYKALKWQSGDTANIKAEDIEFQLGIFKADLWKSVYSVQIGA